MERIFPRAVTVLGLSGLAPQWLCLGVAVSFNEWRWVAVAAGCFYAAVILSFLGGLWWMQALLRDSRGAGIYLLAVAPSLVAWAALLPWCFAWSWPGPSLVALAMCLAASPLVDQAIARHVGSGPGWIALRWMMASGLATATLLLSLI